MTTQTQPRRGDWIQTHTLRKFFPLAPVADDVTVEDVSHALSLLCRFAGHIREFYSVAEHSVRVSFLAERMADARFPAAHELNVARWGLLHDASEAYLVDVPRPVKHTPAFASYRDAELTLTVCIAHRFGLLGSEPPEVKRADSIMCYTEARDLFTGVHPDWEWFDRPLDERITSWRDVLGPVVSGGLLLAERLGWDRVGARLLRARVKLGTMSPRVARAAFRIRFRELFP